VQNATAATFGYPTGSNSFTVELTSVVSSGPGTGSISQTRVIRFTPPSRMAVYSKGPNGSRLGSLNGAAATSALGSYVAIVGGPVDWVQHGSDFTRTERLVPFAARVKPQSATLSTTATGTVYETAYVMDGLLVYLSVKLVVDRQTLANGSATTGGVESQTFHFIGIGGHAAPTFTP
jgi:hypothetical protein